MSLELAEKRIERVQLIDDDEEVRTGYASHVEDMEIKPLHVNGPITDITQLINLFDPAGDAVICDYNLKLRNYSVCNGDEIVAQLYKRHYPAILCTRYDTHSLPTNRLRQFIPCILSPNELSPDKLRKAFKVCVDEFRGVFEVSRKPWKQTIRIEGGDVLQDGEVLRANLVIPGWNPDVGVLLDISRNDLSFFEQVRNAFKVGEVFRAFARVNIGAERPEELYFVDWSLR